MPPIADQCDAILKEGHADAAVLNLGGTVKLYGKKPDGKRFSVGVADPDNPAGYFGYLSCEDGVVATSGGYERYFERDGKRYIHILDPATAKPVENGIQSYRAHPDFDFIILTDDHSVYLTEGVYDEFTLCDGYDFHLKKVDR